MPFPPSSIGEGIVLYVRPSIRSFVRSFGQILLLWCLMNGLNNF